jgi:hypothetical protein
MAWVHRLWVRLQSLLRRERFAKELEREIQFHLDELTTENIAIGMSQEEARYAATRAFGNSTLLKEEARETWGWTWLEQIGQDLRYGFRGTQRRESPVFMRVSVLICVPN